MTPVFAHGDLRLYLLNLLAEAPRHGYELIQALSERFGGTYSPSAGTIYPRLAKLEEEGLVTRVTEGRKSVYRITDAGRAELAARVEELSTIEQEVTDSVRRLANEVRAGVDEAMKSLRADLASAAREARSTAGHGADAGGQGTEDPRYRSRAALRDAEVVIGEFRQQLRTDLRRQTAQSELPQAVVEQLRSELAAVRARILAALPRR